MPGEVAAAAVDDDDDYDYDDGSRFSYDLSKSRWLLNTLCMIIGNVCSGSPASLQASQVWQRRDFLPS